MAWNTAHIALVVAAAIGTVDVAEFLARRLGMFKASPQRARGSLALLVMWAVLLGVGVADWNTIAAILSALLLVAGIALVVVHVRHRLGSWRMYGGPVAAAAALVAALLGR